MTPPDPTEPGFRETDNIVVPPDFAKVDLSLRGGVKPRKPRCDRNSEFLSRSERATFSATGLFHALLPGDGLTRAFARAGIRAGALAANRQAAAMPQAAITANVFQPSDILLKLSPQLAFDHIFAIEDAGQTCDLFVGQIFRLALRIDACFLAKLQRSRRANPVDITERDVGRLIARK